MKYDEAISELLGSSIPTYYNWKREKRPIIELLKYFTKEELEEYLETDKIEKFEILKDKTTEEIKSTFVKEHNEIILAQIEELKLQLK